MNTPNTTVAAALATATKRQDELTKLKADVERLRKILEPLAAQSENESTDRTRTNYDSVAIPRMYLRNAARALEETK